MWQLLAGAESSSMRCKWGMNPQIGHCVTSFTLFTYLLYLPAPSNWVCEKWEDSFPGLHTTQPCLLSTQTCGWTTPLSIPMGICSELTFFRMVVPRVDAHLELPGAFFSFNSKAQPHPRSIKSQFLGWNMSSSMWQMLNNRLFWRKSPDL